MADLVAGAAPLTILEAVGNELSAVIVLMAVSNMDVT